MLDDFVEVTVQIIYGGRIGIPPPSSKPVWPGHAEEMWGNVALVLAGR